MTITYPTTHRWEKPVSADPFDGFGKSNRARLRSTLAQLESHGITTDISPLTTADIAWFEPWYQTSIGSKPNPKISAIAETTIHKENAYPYFILTVSQHGIKMGATIFSLRRAMISIAYRIYETNWHTGTLQANPALLAEYTINEYAHTISCTSISHGRDRNPYGPNANIGLALFKLSVGCFVTLPKSGLEVVTLDLASTHQDILVMHTPASGTRVTDATLYASQDVLEKYSAVTKYPHLLVVHTILRHA
jgi:hypothetical protein